MKSITAFLKKKHWYQYLSVALIFIVLIVLTKTLLYAASIPNTFESGTTISSSEMNENFGYLADRSWELSSNDIYYTKGNVGIGTTESTAKLEILDLSDLYQKTLKIYCPDMITGDREIISFGKDDSTFNAAELIFYCDGDASLNNRLTFKLHSSTEAINILGSGNVGIGTTSPTELLHLVDNKTGRGSLKLEDTSHDVQILFKASVTEGRIQYQTTGAMSLMPADNVGIGSLSPDSSYKLYVVGAAYSTGGWSGSDEKWKKNIEPLENSLNMVNQLQGINYEWRVDEYPNQGFTEGKQIGLIAQDVEQIIPEIVRTNDDGYKSISYEKLTAVLVEAIKEQQIQIEELKKENRALRTELKTQNKELLRRIEALESY